MKKRQSVRNDAPSADEIKRDKALREKNQKWRPTLKELGASGESSKPITQQELLSLTEFAAAIRARRVALGLSLADVAQSTGMDRGAISKLESGHIENPTFCTLQRVANALGKQVRLSLDDARQNRRSTRSR